MSGQRETNAANADIAGRANFFNETEARRNREFQAQQTSAQMEFQERMANTAHRREMADLKAAGINPILAANSGAPMAGGAAAGGDSASATTAKMDNPYVNFGSMMSSALEAAQSAANIDKTLNETKLIKKNTKLGSSKAEVDDSINNGVVKPVLDKIRQMFDDSKWLERQPQKKQPADFKMPKMFRS